MDNTLTIKDETGRDCKITVLDILDRPKKKTIMLYFFHDDPRRVYASYLNETENEFSLDPITDPADIAYADSEIDGAVREYIEMRRRGEV